MPPLTPYEGSERKLVLAFDVGTTYSGISYCILQPGQVPEVKGVTKFPAHELVHGSSKIPSIIYYDKDGVARAIGAETLRAGVFETAQDEGWTKVEWFKLQLGFSSIKSTSSSVSSFISTLPPEKNAVDVLADYLGYLLRCSRQFIEESVSTEPNAWQTFEEQGIDFVLSHPNGWDGVQQSYMRKAAVKANLIDSASSKPSSLVFVSEGEASLHFAISHCLPLGPLSENGGLIVVDAGGGTIDMSAYKQIVNFRFEEISVRRCHLEGSIFVSRRLEALLYDRLRGSKFADDIPHIVSSFDNDTKLTFAGGDGYCYIKFGSARDNDESYGIRYGQLKLPRDDLASCFTPSINRIINDIEEIIKTANEIKIKRAILVGGFAANDWLYHSVCKALLLYGVFVTRPAFPVSKAVADGAIKFYLERQVNRRVSTVTFGVRLWKAYSPSVHGHASVNIESMVHCDGTRRLLAFRAMLRKGEVISRYHEIRKHCSAIHSDDQQIWTTDVVFFTFHGVPPAARRCIWIEDESLFSELFSVQVNLQHLRGTTGAKRYTGPQGPYYKVNFDVILVLSDVELSTMVVWKDQGVEKRLDAEVVYTDAAFQALWIK